LDISVIFSIFDVISITDIFTKVMNTKGAPLKNKKGRTGVYFTDDTQQAILEYVRETDPIKRDIILKKHLMKPIRKICEIYYWKINTSYLDKEYTAYQLQLDCFTHLITKTLDGFTEDKGKAFAYLSISARNHYIQLNEKAKVAYNKTYHSFVEHDEEMEDVEEARLLHNREFLTKYYSFIQWVRDGIDGLPFSSNIKSTILNVLELMEEFDEIENYYRLEVNNAFRKRFPDVKEASYKTAKEKVHHLWLQYQKNITDEVEFKPYYWNNNSSAKNLPVEVQDRILSHYKPGTHSNSVAMVSVKMGVPKHIVCDLIKLRSVK
jgi:hypothetical protein